MARNSKSKQTKTTEQMKSTDIDNNNQNETGEISETKDDNVLPEIESLGINSPDNTDQNVTMEEQSNPVNPTSSANDSNPNQFNQTQIERINKLHAEQNLIRQEVMFVKDKLIHLSNNQKNIESRLEASVGTLKERYSTLDSKLDSVIETLSAIKSNKE